MTCSGVNDSGKLVLQPSSTYSGKSICWPLLSCGALNQAVDARAHRKARIDQRIELDALEVFANERQAGLIAQVAGQLLEDEIGHDLLHLRGEEDYSAKLLILKGKLGKVGVQVTDSGMSLSHVPFRDIRIYNQFCQDPRFYK